MQRCHGNQKDATQPRLAAYNRRQLHIGFTAMRKNDQSIFNSGKPSTRMT